MSFRIEYLRQRRFSPSRRARRVRVEGEFPGRQQARSWCRNHAVHHEAEQFFIIHPDGTKEPFTHDS